MPSSSPAPEPDPAIGEAALLQAQTGQEWLSFTKDAYALTQEQLSQLWEDTNAISEEQLALAQKQLTLAEDESTWQRGITEQQMELSSAATKQYMEQAAWLEGIAKADRARYESVFRPLEDRFVEEAKNYDSPERQAQASAEARADVRHAASSAQAQAQRDAAAMGINPTSGRYQALNRSAAMGATLAEADAVNKARQGVRDRGAAMRSDAIQLGLGLPGQSLQTLGAGANMLNAGVGTSASAVGLGLNTSQNTVNTMGTATGGLINTMGGTLAQQGSNIGLSNASTGIMTSGFQGQMAGYQGQANTLQNLYNSEVNMWQAEQQANASMFGGIGSFIGGLAGLFMSDEKKKKDKAEIPEGKALDAVNAMPVEEWTYKDGVADEGRHVGTYAQDFKKQTGRGDGTTIPAQDAIGITMKAVQDLDKKVDRIADAVGLGMAQDSGAPPAQNQNRKAKPPREERKAPQEIGLGIAA